MTKHESHIALLLLALITVGVLCYQLANSGFDDRTDSWSYALLNSNPDHCNFNIEIDIRPPAFSGNKAHQDTSVLKNSREDHYRHPEIPGFFYTDEEAQSVSAASDSQTDYHAGGSILTTELPLANGLYLNGIFTVTD